MKRDHKPSRISKHLFRLVLLALVFVGSMEVRAAGAVHKFQVDGLACPFCSYGVEKQVKAIPGVKSVKVSIKTSTVTVTMKDGVKLTRTQADKAVKAAGFTMRNFK